WEQAATDGAGAALPAFRSVRRVTAAKIPALHDAFKAASLGHADGVHKVAHLEQRRADNVARLHFLGEVAELFDFFDRSGAKLFEVAEQRLGHTLFLLVNEAKLHGVVAVLARLNLDLNNAVRPGQHDGHRDGSASRIIHASMAQFLSEKSEWH